MNYLNFWKTKGLEFITPRNLSNPEGFDIGEILGPMIGEQMVLEVGCGTGRISKFIDPDLYYGVDINFNAIHVAKKRYPNYDFKHITLDEELPQADVVLLYTVCLHIPDSDIEKQLKRFCTAATKQVIIVECMDKNHRVNRAKNAEYDISNHRDAATYIALMAKQGFVLKEQVEKPYWYYEEEGFKIHFLNFVKP